MSSYVLFDDVLDVAYSQFYVLQVTRDSVAMQDAFRGAGNGLCGGATTDSLFLTTGLHTGPVQLRVERHDDAPDLEPQWEDVVETSFAAASQVFLQTWDGAQYPLDLTAEGYRVRYGARGLDQARELDSLVDGPPVDSYKLDFWPSAFAGDRVVKVGSQTAARRHETVRQGLNLGAENSLTGPESHEPTTEWSAPLPTERLARVGGYVQSLMLLDRNLALALSGQSDDTLRLIARRAALDALRVAGLATAPVAGPAVEALQRGGPLPSSFASRRSAHQLLSGAVPQTTVARVPYGGDDIVQQDYAIEAMLVTGAADALASAVDAVVLAAGTRGPSYPQLFDDLRAILPSSAP
ncbi:hypothetical protein COUCH_15475 [Couchioplanes caeruleus]|uniref:hypothetical protein n=1 Tax=Couchioplanes caeruleus TaxID=56438 RepID=UPI0020BF01B3|nr:hypothetical protein [Couchioplanes caeruleus]UQU67581.1 hypothetical protein COUCH_15475 [Couchioplanes caeruleus]